MRSGDYTVSLFRNNRLKFFWKKAVLEIVNNDKKFLKIKTKPFKYTLQIYVWKSSFLVNLQAYMVQLYET